MATPGKQSSIEFNRQLSHSYPFQSTRDVEELQNQANRYDYVRFTVSDFHGIARNKTLPSRHVARFLRQGLGMYCGLLTAGPRSDLPVIQKITDMGDPDALLVAEPGTMHSLPWAGCGGQYKVGEVFCEPHWKHDGSYQDACPRYVARKQLDKLDELGYSILSANEFEFQVVDEKTLKPIFEGVDVFTSVVMATQESLLYEIDKQMFEAGVDTETYQTEYGPGQFEITMRPTKGMSVADQAFIFKNGVKEICQKRGMMATFMSKPFPGHLMNGTHFNHSVWKQSGRNAMYDGTQDDNLSEFTGHWLGGLVKHSKALAALCCPTVNCYRRMGQHWCPDLINWGLMNRFSLYRVKNHGESGTYVENRLPSGACNPYLVLAGTLAAGIDGIVNKIPRPKEADAQGDKLPQTLSEAIKALKDDTVICEALGEEFVEWFTKEKEDCEINKLSEDKNEKDYEAEREMYMKLM